jgi:hypothetical protein
MRLVAEIEPICAVAAAIGQRERPNRDRQRVERRRRTVARRLAGEHPRHVCFDRHLGDAVAAAWARDAYAQRGGQISIFSRGAILPEKIEI